ncbi:MAG: hypothetical protein LBQ31_05465 [Bacteroidales bacterium]|nr:hypothetical protein [Bacteroidales bacterium]
MSKTSLSDIKKVGLKKLLDYRELSERYPYCSCAKVLYLLSLKKLEDPDFNKVLSQTAISVPDRKYLASLLENFSPKLPISVRQNVKSTADNRFFSFTPVADDNTVSIYKTVSGNVGVAENVALSDNAGASTNTTLSNILFGRKSQTESTVGDTDFGRKSQTGSTVGGTDFGRKLQTESHIDIDRFLSDPKKHQPVRVDKNKDYSQIKIDNSSTKEDLSIGTEAMAKLYAEQGNPRKALAIYRNLIAKYPEKILYYNSLIRKLQLSAR